MDRPTAGSLQQDGPDPPQPRLPLAAPARTWVELVVRAGGGACALPHAPPERAWPVALRPARPRLDFVDDASPEGGAEARTARFECLLLARAHDGPWMECMGRYGPPARRILPQARACGHVHQGPSPRGAWGERIPPPLLPDGGYLRPPACLDSRRAQWNSWRAMATRCARTHALLRRGVGHLSNRLVSLGYQSWHAKWTLRREKIQLLQLCVWHLTRRKLSLGWNTWHARYARAQEQARETCRN